MAEVFISYARETQDAAEELNLRLRQLHFTTWMDTGLPVGRNYNESIRRELKDADKVVVIWSPEAAGSPYVNMEAGIAWAWDKYVPLRLSNFAPEAIPAPFTELQAIDIANILGISAALRRPVSDLIQTLIKRHPGNESLPVWVKKAEDAGFKVDGGSSILIKCAVSGSDISLARLHLNGNVYTYNVSEQALKACLSP